jgi:phage repressor protein C with HTH and peptisase S24 domain
MDIGENIKKIRESKNITQPHLASLVGVDPNTVWRWENKKTSPLRSIKKIAMALDVSAAYLLNETDDPKRYAQQGLRDMFAESLYETKNPVPENILEPPSPPALMDSHDHLSARDYNLVALPVLSIEAVVCAGDGASLEYVDSDIEDWAYVSRDDIGVIDETRKPFIIRVEGDSMEGAGINDGSKVVVNPAVEVHDGKTALVCYGLNNENAIKWVFSQTNGGVEIRSANPRYKPRYFTKEEIELGFFHIVGKIMMVITKPLDA